MDYNTSYDLCDDDIVYGITHSVMLCTGDPGGIEGSCEGGSSGAIFDRNTTKIH
jgi:hypothetical protein